MAQRAHLSSAIRISIHRQLTDQECSELKENMAEYKDLTKNRN